MKMLNSFLEKDNKIEYLK